jgi:hypothetical protein
MLDYTPSCKNGINKTGIIIICFTIEVLYCEVQEVSLADRHRVCRNLHNSSLSPNQISNVKLKWTAVITVK